jgi:PleD family two-component response regulator
VRRPRVLVAGTARAIRVVRQSLGDTVELVFASTAAEALGHCGGEVDLLVTHVTFDESRMLDLLQSLRARAANRRVPVVCLRLFGNLSEAMRQAIVEALDALGDARFIDLYEMREQLGEDAALRRLGELLREECVRLRA